MNKFLIFFLLLITIIANAQSDSLYYETYDKKQLSPYINYRNFHLEQNAISLATNSVSVGLRLKLKKITLSGSLPLVTANDFIIDDIQSLGGNLDYFGKRYSLHTAGRYYWNTSDKLLTFPKSYKIFYAIAGGQIALSKKHQFSPAFRMFEQPKKSSGGLVFAPDIAFFYFSTFDTLSFTQLRANIGYVQTFVKDDFYMMLSFLAGPSFSYRHYGESKIKINYIFPSNIKCAAGYYFDKVAVGVSGIYTPTIFVAENLSIDNLLISLLVNIRLYK